MQNSICANVYLPDYYSLRVSVIRKCPDILGLHDLRPARYLFTFTGMINLHRMNKLVEATEGRDALFRAEFDRIRRKISEFYEVPTDVDSLSF